MILLASTVIGSVAVLTVVWLLRPYLDRYITLLEQQARPVVVPAPPQSETPPQDLIAMALSESTGWAREDALAALYELNSDCGGDWTKTRMAYLTTTRGTVVTDAAG